MSKIIKADQVRENPDLVEDIILDTILFSLPDSDYDDSTATGEDFNESLSRNQAQLEEDVLQAEALLLEAEEKSKQIYEEAYTKGFSHGQSAGEAKVLEEAEALLNYFKDLGQAIALSQEKAIASAEESIGKLALEIARKIIRREIQMDESIIRGMVRESLKAIKGSNVIRLKVNAEDADRIRDYKESLLRTVDYVTDFEIIEDPRIEQGGCVVETDYGIVDARIDSQLQEIGRAFFGDTCS